MCSLDKIWYLKRKEISLTHWVLKPSSSANLEIKLWWCPFKKIHINFLLKKRPAKKLGKRRKSKNLRKKQWKETGEGRKRKEKQGKQAQKEKKAKKYEEES